MVTWDGCQHVKKNCNTIDLRGAQVNETQKSEGRVVADGNSLLRQTTSF